MEGTCTGEHGVGVGKKDYVEKELGKEALDLMWTIKQAIDPKNIMNPGKKITARVGVSGGGNGQLNLSGGSAEEGVKITSHFGGLSHGYDATVEINTPEGVMQLRLNWDERHTAKL